MAEPIKTKTCRVCNQTKPITEFYKDRSRKDGHHPYCKNCNKKYNQSEKGKAKQLRHNQTEKRKITLKRYWQTEKCRLTRKHYRQSKEGKAAYKRSRIRYPEHQKARAAVNYAIETGKLTNPDKLSCSCGESAKAYHHHKGYAKEHWLDVIPLCAKCHSKIHIFSFPTPSSKRFLNNRKLLRTLKLKPTQHR